MRFEVVDWENYATIGVGRPQELITQQTLEKHRDSLALVIGIVWQRFGSPTGKADSGTEEEFNWAMASHKDRGFPEVKWFFRNADRLDMPSDPDELEAALEQWRKVGAFKSRMRDLDDPIFYTEYPDPSGFREVLEEDLNRWLMDPARPWITEQQEEAETLLPAFAPPSNYYKKLESDFRRLDISGIDNDKAVEIPLSEIYVRLRVMFDEDTAEENETQGDGPLDIQTALLRYERLVIVGDPGSGKSTFLKYIALMLARAVLKHDPSLALEKLCLAEPLPIPVFVSCWDLADFLKGRGEAQIPTLLEFIAGWLTACAFPIDANGLESVMESGGCCLLFDGLDEVPTDAARAVVSRLLEECVDRFGKNRFVVTSRVRAYTGTTVLRGEFTRCDIQPFDADDRAQFLRNWVAVLSSVQPEQINVAGSDAKVEFENLTRAIEGNERIRPLAVNPLLLTIIAIDRKSVV
ncbi:MAG: NACHT domain-containing protein, partial [Phycisphaerales bacterium JB038]